MNDEEFGAALAAKVASDDEETPTEEPKVSEVNDENENDEVEKAEPVEETEQGYAPEIEAYLSKYDGDVEQALKAAVHASMKIGEQGNELGELRRMVQELAERPEPKAPQTPFVPEDVQAAIDSNPAQVAAWAIQNENPHVYEAAMREWADQDPLEAARFERRLEREMLKAELQSQINPELQHVRQQQAERAIGEAHRTLAAKYPDFQQMLETATADEIAGIPRDLLATAQQENPQAALELVYRWVATGRGQQQAAQSAQRTAQARQQKRDAHVVTGEQSNTTVEPTTMERLKEFMLAPDPQSVNHGLTQ